MHFYSPHDFTRFAGQVIQAQERKKERRYSIWKGIWKRCATPFYTFLHENKMPTPKRSESSVTLFFLSESFTLNLLSEALTKIFNCRNTHSLPQELKPPPKTWKSKFNKLTTECGLGISIDTAFDELENFLRKMIPLKEWPEPFVRLLTFTLFLSF